MGARQKAVGMSLTTTLLHADPESLRQLIKALPKGRVRKNKIDDSERAPGKSDRPKKASGKHLKAKTTSPENCEIVHSTIAAGARTVRDIQCATVLCKTTIWRAIMQLEAWPTGPRIERDSNGKPAQFTAYHA